MKKYSTQKYKHQPIEVVSDTDLHDEVFIPQSSLLPDISGQGFQDEDREQRKGREGVVPEIATESEEAEVLAEDADESEIELDEGELQRWARRTTRGILPARYRDEYVM